MSVDQQQESVVKNGIPEMVFFLDTISCKPHAEAADISKLPVLFRHLLSVRAKPGQIFDVGAVNAAALEKLPATEHRVSGSQHDQVAGERKQGLLLTGDVPIKPTDVIVLTIGVIVALLRPSNFVAAADHGHALRQQ